jgi:four helix bundle protein
MGQFGHAKSFRDLVVYQRARSVAALVFTLTKSFPRDETYSLTSQIRQASRSVGAQIAEAWGKRRYEKHFVSKLSDADSENYETQHWLETAIECGYVASSEAKSIMDESFSVGRMLGSMMQKADLFCASDAHQVKEDREEYFVRGISDD